MTRTRARGSASAAERVTTYGYDGGVLRWVRNAEAQDSDATNGLLTYYSYDVAGRVTREYYSRVKSDGTNAAAYEGALSAYDAAGRVTAQWQATYDTAANAWNDAGPRIATSYNAYGDVVGVALGGVTQQQNQYDGAGRLMAAGVGGVWSYFGYDRQGKATVAISSAGASLAGLSFNQALGLVGQSDVNASYTVYDARGLATSVVEEGRQLSATSSIALSSTRGTNGFGEVAYEINAAGARVDYTYNTAGKLVKKEGPLVSVTYEDGTSAAIRPVEQFYYDASGRLVASRDGQGNLTRIALLAGSGYGGSAALVSAETHADGGVKQTGYDIHGDARVMTDEVGRVTGQSFDGMGRVTQVTHAGGLIDSFAYDGLGHELIRWNSLGGALDKATSDYDIQGRVTARRALGGDVTTTSYVWDATLATGGLGTFGGWAESVAHANGLTSSEDSDSFGRALSKSDLGGHGTSYAYDVAGRQVSSVSGGLTTAFTYYNIGQLASNSGAFGVASYSYDALGQRVAETLVSGGVTIKAQSATYDAAGRMTSWAEAGSGAAGSGGAPAASIGSSSLNNAGQPQQVCIGGYDDNVLAV